MLLMSVSQVVRCNSLSGWPQLTLLSQLLPVPECAQQMVLLLLLTTTTTSTTAWQICSRFMYDILYNFTYFIWMELEANVPLALPLDFDGQGLSYNLGSAKYFTDVTVLRDCLCSWFHLGFPYAGDWNLEGLYTFLGGRPCPSSAPILPVVGHVVAVLGRSWTSSTCNRRCNRQKVVPLPVRSVDLTLTVGGR